MYRVLIADDEPIERAVVKKTIETYFDGQLEVVCAVNGREAVQLFEEEACNIALLDIEMPGVNGLEAAEQIRKKDKVCSIIFLTAFDEFSYAKKAISVRALDYLLKPGADEELVAVLEEAIRLADESGTKAAGGVEAPQLADESGTKAAGDVEAPQLADESGTKAAGDVETAGRGKDTGGGAAGGFVHTAGNIRMTAVAGQIRAYIDTHYMEDISLQTAAGAMNYSEAYFCKIFKQCFDKSFIVYLSEYRVEKAKELLADVVINVKDISASVGYRDSNYFAKVFKRVAGVTPTEYRMQILSAAEEQSGETV